MKSVEFCYWLQGLFELGKPQALSAEQTDLVKRHLAMVFHHEIDPSYGKVDLQAALQKIHTGQLDTKIGGQDADGKIYRC